MQLTKEIIQQFGPEITAWAAGKQIQILNWESAPSEGVPQWEDCEPQWAPTRKYRVKPTPREFWVTIYQHDPEEPQRYLACTPEEAERVRDNAQRSGGTAEVLRVREVV